MNCDYYNRGLIPVEKDHVLTKVFASVPEVLSREVLYRELIYHRDEFSKRGIRISQGGNLPFEGGFHSKPLLELVLERNHNLFKALGMN